VEDREGRVPMVSPAELPLSGPLLAVRLITKKNHKAEKRKARKHLLLLALNNTNVI
jgi:hypothetical protein